MRKKPWAKDMILQRQDCVIANPEEMAGTWRKYGKQNVVVEIGAGKGDYWINMAHMYPDELWVAVEKNIDAAGIALKKSLDNTSENMKFIVNDAANISQWFAEGEVDRIHLNFSDPWPKKHHTKRRLTYGSFLSDYARILKKQGKLMMFTVRGDGQTIEDTIRAQNPVYMEMLPLTLEEVFISEMEAVGYDIDNILE